MRWLLGRAALAFLALPGVVAFVIPWWLLGRPSALLPFRWIGMFPLIAGVSLLLWCVGSFYRHGRGTLAPWDPPRNLVAVGPYRVSRNPMYVAVSLVLWGWAVGYRSRTLVNYALLVMIVFYLRVILFEEPWLADRYGERWVEYRSRVPRWIGVVRKPPQS
jgi:protein-S-isoprenylcysteine O-methyltransferase Ste14